MLLERHPSWGIAELRAELPGLPRNSTTAFLRRLRRLRKRRRRRRRPRLKWVAPGAVWAIDGTWLDQPVGPLGRRALIVVELHSKRVLALQSVPGERADAVEQVLAALIAKHGAPLVLKLDNGSAFIAKRTAIFCRSHGISLMHSPPRTPRFNGTVEVCGRWAKARVTRAAEARGARGELSQADLDAAVNFVGELPRIDADDRARFQDAVAEHLRVVAAERGLVLGPAFHDHARRRLSRVAVQRALIQCHMLTIEGRGYIQSLPRSSA